MSHLQKVANPYCDDDLDENHPIVVGIAASQQRRRACCSQSCFGSCLQLLNTVILVLILLTVAHGYFKLHTQMHKYERLMNAIADPQNADPAVADGLARLVKSTAEAFLFGNSNGSIAVFLQNSLFGFDFPKLGSSVLQFANQVQLVMTNSPALNQCQQYATCSTTGTFQCANGNVRWCSQPGDRVNCASDSCIASSIVTGATLIGSVAERVSKVQPVASTNPFNGSAAFSAGVFRLDEILKWVESQTNAAEWKAMAKACQVFAFEVKNIQWTGTYLDPNSQVTTWDANRQVREVVGYIEQVCDPLANLGPTSKKTTSKQ